MLLYNSNADKERHRNYNGKFDYHSLVLITMILVAIMIFVMIMDAMIIVVMIIVIVAVIIVAMIIVIVASDNDSAYPDSISDQLAN